MQPPAHPQRRRRSHRTRLPRHTRHRRGGRDRQALAFWRELKDAGYRTGLVYYTISRQFDAVRGASGASLLPSLASALRAHGFKTAAPEDVGVHMDMRAATGVVGLSVLAFKTSPLVQVNIDTQCSTK